MDALMMTCTIGVIVGLIIAIPCIIAETICDKFNIKDKLVEIIFGKD